MDLRGKTYPRNLSEELKSLLPTDSDVGISIGEVFDGVGDKGFGLLLIILSLPSALPVPAPGYSTPFGIILSLLAIQMILGSESPWIPHWARKRVLGRGLADKMIAAATRVFSIIERWIEPRFTWVGSRVGHIIMGSLVLIMAGLMILPIPLTNTIPAMVIFLIGVGLSEEDGLFLGGACLLGGAAVVLYIGIVALFFYAGEKGIDQLMEQMLG